MTLITTTATSTEVPGTINPDNDNVSFSSELSNISNSSDKQKYDLMVRYNDCKTLKPFSKNTLQSINRAVWAVVLPHMKFITSSKRYGSFEQPDFTDPNSFVHRVFNQLGNLKNTNFKTKVNIWMTYRYKIKEQFSLHRSSITSQLKILFLKGKNQV